MNLKTKVQYALILDNQSKHTDGDVYNDDVLIIIKTLYDLLGRGAWSITGYLSSDPDVSEFIKVMETYADKQSLKKETDCKWFYLWREDTIFFNSMEDMAIAKLILL